MLWTFDPVISHRGASAYAPENTLAAFDLAYAQGSRIIEFDVMLSADGEAFVFHDPQLTRTSNGHGEFGWSDSAYIQSLDAGSWFSPAYQDCRIPSLREVFAWLVHHRVTGQLEIKPYPGFTEETTRVVMAHIQDHWPRSHAKPLVSSFDPAALALCRQLSKDQPLALLPQAWHTDVLQRAQELNVYAIHLCREDTTPERVTLIKDHGYCVCVYTIDDANDARQLLQWGVDAVFSNRPDLLATPVISVT